MRRKLVLATCSLIVLGAELASAKTVSCAMTSMERTVELRYQNPGEAVPCEIRYSKPSEGVDNQTLWRAEREAGYCEARFDEFVDKLRGFGWSCGAADSGAPPAASDDLSGSDAGEEAPETETGEAAAPTGLQSPEAPASG